MKELTPTELSTVNNMSAEQRYDYFISALLEHKKVWGLSGDGGWLVLPDEDEEQLPVWPHAQLAQAWAMDDFADCQPKPITLEDWLNKWLPGMIEDGLLVAVCPGTDNDSISVAADELLDELRQSGDEEA